MAVGLEATTAADLDEVSRLLCAAFDAPPDAPFVNRELMHWKCFDGASALGAPCSYVLRHGERIVAHCGVVPLTLEAPARAASVQATTPASLSGVAFFDWAGDRRIPGAAVVLLKKLMARGDVAIVPGGSAATRSVLPKIGFLVHQNVNVFAKVVRPLRQARSRPLGTPWRDGLRLARNTVWSLAGPGKPSNEWSARSVTHFTADPDAMVEDCIAPRRSAAYLNHWLRCPAAKVSAFYILREHAIVGYFVLSHVGGQTRVADLRIWRLCSSDLEVAYSVAISTAAYDPATCEVVCTASTPAVVSALKACGLRYRGAEPLFVHDPRGVLKDAPPLLWSMLEDDAAYVADPVNPYVT